MRKFVTFILGGSTLLAAAFLTSPVAEAEVSSLSFSCDLYARAAADIVTKDDMQRAGVRETAAQGRVMIIAAGSKFSVPAKQNYDAVLQPRSVYSDMQEWHTAYRAAYNRCR